MKTCKLMMVMVVIGLIIIVSYGQFGLLAVDQVTPVVHMMPHIQPVSFTVHIVMPHLQLLRWEHHIIHINHERHLAHLAYLRGNHVSR